MTAIPHSNSIPPVSPSADVLADPLHTLAPNRTARRRIEVDRAAAEIVKAAEDAGWIITDRRTFSHGTSIYLDMHLTRKTAVTVRISDHCPSRPLGIAGDRPCLLVLVGVPGGISHATRWLESTAREVYRVVAGKIGSCRLRKAGNA